MCCDMAPSGEEIIFGSAEGYMHLWALTQEPCVSQLSRPLEQVPRLATPPTTALSEGDSFALAAVHLSEQVSCLPSVRQIRLDCCLGASKAVWIKKELLAWAASVTLVVTCTWACCAVERALSSHESELAC